MPNQVDVFKVFIASPGGLEAEREAVRDEIAKFNDSFMGDLRIIFCDQGWEAVPGGLRRPQELINKLIEECDYMILILGSRWGTNPAIGGRFTSGTEEEFHVAQDCIRSPTSPMSDILVLFKAVPEGQLRDPGEQLRKVLQFKKQLEDSKSLLYKTFDDLDGLRQEVRMRLRGWATSSNVRGKDTGGAQPATEAAPATIPDSPLADLATDIVDEVPEGIAALRVAEEYEAKGLMTQAEAAYAKAIADDDAVSLEKYARFLRRTGRLSKSLEINRRILARLASNQSSSDTTSARARILTSIGIVERKLGDLRASRYALQEAVQTARLLDGETDALAYSLDNLGLTATRVADSNEAMTCYNEALTLRKASGDLPGQAQTLTNISRIHKRLGNVFEARKACSAAIEILERLDEKAPLAAAYAAMGEILEQESDLDGAEASYKRALALNEAMGMPDSIAMSVAQIARILLERGDFVAAQRFAQRSLDENELTSNREGAVGARHLLGRILAQTGRERVAMGMLEEAAGEYAEIKNPNGEGWARFHLAEVQQGLGMDAEAAASIGNARNLAVFSGNASLLTQIDKGF